MYRLVAPPPLPVPELATTTRQQASATFLGHMYASGASEQPAVDGTATTSIASCSIGNLAWDAHLQATAQIACLRSDP